MSSEIYPTWLQKVNAVRDAVAWATGVCGDWAYKSSAFSLPEDNEAWFDLRMGRILTLGMDETRNVDNIDPLTGDPDVENPRAEVACGQRQFFVEIRAYNTDQEQDSVAWWVLERARTRLGFDYVESKFLAPVNVTIVETLQVIPMPAPRKPVEMRWRSEALLEFDLSTVSTEQDDAAVGTWIETVEISSQMRNAGGGLLDPSVQLNDEVMP